MHLKVKSLLPVLVALAFLSLVSLQVLFLVMTWLGLSIGRGFEGFYSLLWKLAAGFTVLSVVLAHLSTLDCLVCAGVGLHAVFSNHFCSVPTVGAGAS